MQKVAIVTDSTADLSDDFYKKYDITVVPLSVIFGEDIYTDDGVSITKSQFYDRLKTEKKLPTTTQPSPADFKKAYSKILENHESIISIHISKKMSGTYDSAEMARREMPDSDITVIDSEVTTMALGLIVYKAGELAFNNESKEQIIKRVNEIKSKINTLFIPHTLEYLQKGGRIGRAKGLIASLLEIKPLLTLQSGEVCQFKTTRRWNQAKGELLSSIQSMIKDGSRVNVSVADADMPEEGNEMAEKIKSMLDPKFIFRTKIGVIVGTHLGPGIAVAFYEE